MNVHIKIANLAVNLNCNILTDKEGDICLLQKFYDHEGKEVVRHRPEAGDYHSQSDWLKSLKDGNYRNLKC